MVLKERQGGHAIRFRTTNADAATVSRHDVAHPIKDGPNAASSSSFRRRVRFAEDRNRSWASPHPVLEPADVARRWYSAAELKRLKERRNRLARDIVEADRKSKSHVTFQTVLVHAFNACCGIRDSNNDNGNISNNSNNNYSNNTPRNGADSSRKNTHDVRTIHDDRDPLLSAQAFCRLSRTLELCPSRLGMEWLAVPDVGVRQYQRRTELRRELKSLQQRWQQEPANRPGTDPNGRNPGGSLESPSLAERLRSTSEAYSRPSCLYATLVATAHVFYDVKP